MWPRAAPENLFIIRKGKLITPDVASDILEGITRDAVIELAGDLGIPVEELPIGRTEIYRADEIFLCGTGCQISLVRSVDRRNICDQKGPLTTAIQERYENAVYGRDPNRPIGSLPSFKGTSRARRRPPSLMSPNPAPSPASALTLTVLIAADPQAALW